MTGDLTITFDGQTIVVPNAVVTFGPAPQDLSRFTDEQLEECVRLFDAVIGKYPGEAYRAFNRAHPNGGQFFFMADGTLGFAEKGQPAPPDAGDISLLISIRKLPADAGSANIIQNRAPANIAPNSGLLPSETGVIQPRSV